jgi:hypothetical protein
MTKSITTTQAIFRIIGALIVFTMALIMGFARNAENAEPQKSTEELASEYQSDMRSEAIQRQVQAQVGTANDRIDFQNWINRHENADGSYK